MYIGVLRTCQPSPPVQGSSVGQEKKYSVCINCMQCIAQHLQNTIGYFVHVGNVLQKDLATQLVTDTKSTVQISSSLLCKST